MKKDCFVSDERKLDFIQNNSILTDILQGLRRGDNLSRIKYAKFSRKFCKERNLFTINAPIRRIACKKLHKVFHKFLLRCFAP